MRIAPPNPPQGDPVLPCEALRRAALRMEAGVRPCPGCRRQCPSCASRTCVCECRMDCTDAARALSSEPDRFPVETGIVPLAWALNRMGLQTCWSCEGHMKGEYGLLRPPQVWFYAQHPVWISTIEQSVGQLHGDGLISCPWHVQIAMPGRTVAYSLCPADPPHDRPLQALQADAQAVARLLPERFLAAARRVAPA